MDREMIQYFADTERHIRNLEERVRDLEGIIHQMCYENKNICPHRYEEKDIMTVNGKDITTYICSLCGDVYKEVKETSSKVSE